VVHWWDGHVIGAATKTVGTNNWTVFIIAASASAIGALVAGVVTWWLNRQQWRRQSEADTDRWLRERRADLYTGIFAEFREWVDERTEDLKRRFEPHVDLRARERFSNGIQDMDRLYSDLRAHAIAASMA
jgi:hypothetical protein